jgi:hypothetical protein
MAAEIRPPVNGALPGPAIAIPRDRAESSDRTPDPVPATPIPPGQNGQNPFLFTNQAETGAPLGIARASRRLDRSSAGPDFPSVTLSEPKLVWYHVWHGRGQGFDSPQVHQSD